MKHVCQYAILRFVPYPETGEFANVGVVLVNAELNYFGFKLTHRGWGRISTFFELLDRNIFVAALQGYEKTLERLCGSVDAEARQNASALKLFQELTRRRNGVIQYSDLRVRVAEDPEAALQHCFDQYVNRHFLEKTSPDVLLEQRVRSFLREEGLARRYQKRMVGDKTFNINLPFVRFASQRRGETKVASVIKPLHLAHPKPSDITDHGLIWKSRLIRLRDQNFISPSVLLPVEGPKPGAEGDMAFKQIREDLMSAGFNVVGTHETDKILDFAQQ